MIILINYANKGFINSRKSLNKTAIDTGEINKVIEYNSTDIDPEFIYKNEKIFSSPRGAGFWLWKPYLILKTLEQIRDNDILVYSDCGIVFVSSIENYVRFMNGSFMLFQHIDCIEHEYTKSDTFELLNCRNNSEITNTSQLYASFSIWKKNENSIAFLKEWIRYCENYHCISDEPSIIPNAPTFKDNRHDQSIMSCLAKLYKNKYNIQIEKDPTQYGNTTFRNNVFPQLLINNHTKD